MNAEELEKTVARHEMHLQALKEKFGLTRVGGRKSGHWEFLSRL